METHAHAIYMLEKLLHKTQEEEKTRMSEEEWVKLVQDAYTPLHPDLSDLSNWAINPLLTTALEESAKGNNGPLCQVLDQEGEGIFAFQFLEKDFGLKLIQEMDHFESFCLKNGTLPKRPNSMNRYGAILKEIGLGHVMSQIVSVYINPLSAFFFRHIGASLDSNHSFLVDYELGKDRDLSFHVDQSDVTLNVCLGSEFTGGSLFFGGVRCNQHTSTNVLSYEAVSVNHTVGRALLHLGKHRHLASPVESGRRTNLIIWCNSSSFSLSHNPSECAEWCEVHKVQTLHQTLPDGSCSCGNTHDNEKDATSVHSQASDYGKGK